MPVLTFLALSCLVPPESAPTAEYGSIEGRFVFEGEISLRPVLVPKGDETVKDAHCCAISTITDDSLLVDSKSRGIANIFVYLRKVEHIHPKLKSNQKKELLVQVRNCQYEPRTLVVRTGQTVKVTSHDSVVHNPHPIAIRNPPSGILVQDENPTFTFRQPEILPIQVKCDIHPWMISYWLILDHPYAAVSNSRGEFRIENVPAGEHQFRVWQEKAGWVKQKVWTWNITAGETTNVGEITVPADEFVRESQKETKTP